MPNVEVNGASFYYEQTGSGTPVVFVHGAMCDHRTWKSQVLAVSGSHRAVTYSRRFAAPNTNTGDIMESTVERNTADLAAIIDRLGLAPAHVVGHSYGGNIAAYLALTRPELVRSVTLNNAFIPSMLLKNPGNPIQLLTLLFSSPSVAMSARRVTGKVRESMKAADAGRLEEAAAIFYGSLFEKGTAVPGLSDEFKKMMADNAKGLKETTARQPRFSESEAGTVKVPTLVIRGSISARWDLKISEKLTAAIPGAESAFVSGGGHFCALENPSEFNSLLSEFLAKHN